MRDGFLNFEDGGHPTYNGGANRSPRIWTAGHLWSLGSRNARALLKRVIEDAFATFGCRAHCALRRMRGMQGRERQGTSGEC
jgi:hypothetical protein